MIVDKEHVRSLGSKIFKALGRAAGSKIAARLAADSVAHERNEAIFQCSGNIALIESCAVDKHAVLVFFMQSFFRDCTILVFQIAGSPLFKILLATSESDEKI